MRKIFFSFIIILFFLVSTLNVAALRLSYQTPTKLDFYPNLEFTRVITVTNERSTTMNITLQILGNLVEYATISKSSVLLGGGSSEDIILVVKLPAELENPGQNNIGLKASEKPIISGAALGGFVSVGMYYDVMAPYPGKYIESSLLAGNVKENEKINIEINVVNRGKEDLNSIFSTVSIYNKNNEKLETIHTNQLSLISQESGTLTGRFDTLFPAGEYEVLAMTNFDGENKEDTAVVNVGTLQIDIINFTKTFKTNSIEKFEVFAKSRWNDPITNVYAKLTLKDLSNNKVTESATPPDTLTGFETKKLEGYFNTNNIVSGEYIAEVTLYYSEKETTKLGSVLITEPPVEEQPKQTDLLTTTNLLIAITVLVVILISMVAVMFFKMNDSGRKKKK